MGQPRNFGCRGSAWTRRQKLACDVGVIAPTGSEPNHAAAAAAWRALCVFEPSGTPRPSLKPAMTIEAPPSTSPSSSSSAGASTEPHVTTASYEEREATAVVGNMPAALTIRSGRLASRKKGSRASTKASTPAQFESAAAAGQVSAAATSRVIKSGLKV